MTCTISCASMRARIKSSHFTVTVCPTDFCFKCETASLITSSTSWLVSSSFRRPSFSRVTYNRFSTTSISHSESSYISLYICCFVVSSKQFPLCKSVSALPEIEQRGVRRSCEIDLKRSARSCSLLQDLLPVLFQQRCVYYPLPEHIRSQLTARCCFRMNRAFQVSSVFRSLHRLCSLHGSQDKDIRIVRTVLLLLLYGDRFGMPILRLSVLQRSADFQSMCTFFGEKPSGRHSIFTFCISNNTAVKQPGELHTGHTLRYHRCFSLFAADGRCRTAPACGTQNELKVSHDP